MKHKTCELEGALLDAAVAMAEGYEWHTVPKDYDGEHGGNKVLMPPGLLKAGWQWPPKGPVGNYVPTFSTNWSVGGPIIERERLAVFPGHGDAQPLHDGWTALLTDDETGDYIEETEQIGGTPLIAAMRAYVASKFGEEVEL